MGEKHTVRLEPVGIEFEVDEDETVLHGAFRQGLQLMHGCKEGQCSSCKSFLLDGEVDLDRYSTFALPDFEEQEGWTLLCRAHALTDLEVELINYDEDDPASGPPAGGRRRPASTAVERADARHPPARARARRAGGARVPPRPVRRHLDPGRATAHHRSFSMANLPSDKGRLEFMIKLYPDGRFSGLLGSGEICEGDRARDHGPVRGVHAARPVAPPAGVHRRRRRDGADPVPAALAAASAGSSATPSTTTARARRPTCSTARSSRRWRASCRPSASSPRCPTPSGTARPG